jgi:16S rRNA (guanine(966)-N(2))-methyltransferase RsmD
MSGLRVIAGTAKGRKLKMVPDASTRPITDRVKESLFDILGSDVERASVLDLFAGTGSVGIEALSRGAARAVFVESHRLAVSILQANVQTAGVANRAHIVRSDVFIYLRNQPRSGFDYVHIAPPQYQNLWTKTLEALDARPDWVNPEGVAVVQIHPREFADLALRSFAAVDQRRYGSTLLVFYERNSA